jgi:DNA-binding NarL/FixJ family response regulator
MHPSNCAILVAAPPTLYRQGLLTTLRDTWPGLNLILVTDAYALPSLVRQRAFTLLVLDSALAGPQLPDLLAQLRVIRHQQPVLVLTNQRLSPNSRQNLLQSGGTLLSRHVTPTDFIETIRPWLSGETGGSLAPPAPAGARSHRPPTPLSRRELDVLRLVVGDCCNQEIAAQLHLSVRTVESHRRALLQKTGARTLVGLVMQAVREGWVVT